MLSGDNFDDVFCEDSEPEQIPASCPSVAPESRGVLGWVRAVFQPGTCLVAVGETTVIVLNDIFPMLAPNDPVVLFSDGRGGVTLKNPRWWIDYMPEADAPNAGALSAPALEASAADTDSKGFASTPSVLDPVLPVIADVVLSGAAVPLVWTPQRSAEVLLKRFFVQSNGERLAEKDERVRLVQASLPEQEVTAETYIAPEQFTQWVADLLALGLRRLTTRSAQETICDLFNVKVPLMRALVQRGFPGTPVLPKGALTEAEYSFVTRCLQSVDRQTLDSLRRLADSDSTPASVAQQLGLDVALVPPLIDSSGLGATVHTDTALKASQMQRFLVAFICDHIASEIRPSVQVSVRSPAASGEPHTSVLPRRATCGDEVSFLVTEITIGEDGEERLSGTVLGNPAVLPRRNLKAPFHLSLIGLEHLVGTRMRVRLADPLSRPVLLTMHKTRTLLVHRRDSDGLHIHAPLYGAGTLLLAIKALERHLSSLWALTTDTRNGVKLELYGVQLSVPALSRSWEKHGVDSTALAEGSRVEVWPFVDLVEGTIEISLKSVDGPEWLGICKNHPIGSFVTGLQKHRRTRAGVEFVVPDPSWNVVGFVPCGDLTDGNDPNEAPDFGAPIDAEVIGHDRNRRVLLLSLRRTNRSPWKETETLAGSYLPVILLSAQTRVLAYWAAGEVTLLPVGSEPPAYRSWMRVASVDSDLRQITFDEARPVQRAIIIEVSEHFALCRLDTGGTGRLVGATNMEVGQQLMVRLHKIHWTQHETRIDVISADAETTEPDAPLTLGQVVNGVVKGCFQSGAFIDLGVCDAFLPNSEVSYRKKGKAAAMLKPGQEIRAKVISVDGKHPTISVKALSEDPYAKAETTYPIGAEVEGTIRSVADYGVFVELEPGLEGLLHINEMVWHSIKSVPKEYREVGRRIRVKIIALDVASRRVNLSTRALSEDPFASVETTHPVGSEIEGTIKTVVDFGVFVELEPSIQGLLHISEMRWRSSKSVPTEYREVGRRIRVKVIDIDVAHRRVSLSIRRLVPDPFIEFMRRHNVGQWIAAEVTNVTEFGAFVRLADDLEGLVHKSKVPPEVLARLCEGDQISVEISEIEASARRISLVWRPESAVGVMRSEDVHTISQPTEIPMVNGKEPPSEQPGLANELPEAAPSGSVNLRRLVDRLGSSADPNGELVADRFDSPEPPLDAPEDRVEPDGAAELARPIVAPSEDTTLLPLRVAMSPVYPGTPALATPLAPSLTRPTLPETVRGSSGLSGYDVSRLVKSIGSASEEDNKGFGWPPSSEQDSEIDPYELVEPPEVQEDAGTLEEGIVLDTGTTVLVRSPSADTVTVNAGGDRNINDEDSDTRGMSVMTFLPEDWADQQRAPLLRISARALLGERVGLDQRPLFEGYVGLMVLHFLEDLRGLLHAFDLVGLKPERTYLWYKKYQYLGKQKLIEELTRYGYHVFPLEDLKSTMVDALESAKALHQRVIILEDGGYLVPLLHQMDPMWSSLVVGAVEQTERGTRNDERIDALRFPVIDVARSKLKERAESRHVGRAIVRNVQRLLKDRMLNGLRCLVVGYGRIGKAVAEAAKAEGMIPLVYDKDPGPMIEAHNDGIETSATLSHLLDRANLIIGTTGNTSLGEVEISCLRHNSVLASGSSGQEEIGVAALKLLSKRALPTAVGTEFTLEKEDRKVLLLADGYPVNFHEADSVPTEVIDIVLSALFVATAALAAGRALPVGISTAAADEIFDEWKLERRYHDLHK